LIECAPNASITGALCARRADFCGRLPDARFSRRVEPRLIRLGIDLVAPDVELVLALGQRLGRNAVPVE
jgi:hypothetical protein